MRKYVLVIILIVFALTIYNTSGKGRKKSSKNWVKSYGGKDDDTAVSLKVVPDGYIVFGYTLSFDAPVGDFWLFKLDLNGKILWQKRYGGRSYDSPGGSLVTSKGNIIITGLTQSLPEEGDTSGLVIKLDQSGNILWQKAYTNVTDPYGASSIKSAMLSKDGDFIVVGKYKGTGSNDALIMKLTGDGNIKWCHAYGGKRGDHAIAVLKDSDGEFLIAGNTESFGAGKVDYWVIKTDIQGKILWQRAYGGDKIDRLFGAVKTGDGGYIIAGASFSFTYKYGLSGWLLKIDGKGDIVWEKAYPGATFFSIIKSEKNTFTATGSIARAKGKKDDLWVIQLNEKGEPISQYVYTGWGYENGFTIQEIKTGFIIGGITTSRGAGRSEALVLKLNKKGMLPKSRRMRKITRKPISTRSTKTTTNAVRVKPELSGYETSIVPVNTKALVK